MTKTAVLSGSEVEVSDLGGQNVAVKNLGDSSIYASPYPNVVAGADNVVEIPAGSGEVVLDANGTVYLLGTGKAQCTGMSYATPNFKMPSSSSGNGGGGGTSSGVICGTFEFADFDGVRSIPILIGEGDTIPKKFAAALAEETGWELQSDDVTVLKDGEIGFAFESRSSLYVWMCTSAGYVYDTDFKCLEFSTSAYYMDICETKNGTVAFGFRPSSEPHINLTFVLSNNGAGQTSVLTGFNGIRYVVNSFYRVISNSWISRIYSTASYIVNLNVFPDVNNGGFFQDLFVVRTDPRYLDANKQWVPGDRIIVNEKRFVLVFNKMYGYYDQGILALPLD